MCKELRVSVILLKMNWTVGNSRQILGCDRPGNVIHHLHLSKVYLAQCSEPGVELTFGVLRGKTKNCRGKI